MRLRIFFFTLVAIFGAAAFFCPDGRANTLAIETEPISHAIWNDLLHKHVKSDGFVDYKGFIRDSAKLNQYLALLSGANPESKSWSREEKMAFWINAYNAFTVDLIVQHYPVKSIKDIKRGIAFVNSVWDIQFIHIGGKTYDLNNIEHNILRSKFKDARVHATINCASWSCPRLRPEAYTAQKLDAQLTDAMHGFVNDPSRNKVKADKAEISEIFKWFSGDFVRDAGSVRAFINRYADEKVSATGKITHLDYDWRLNEAR
jgi:hypothetical protein